ncbi:hypothetical protein PILCRDRAFT_168856 [Piloderma croceum F 1598]|uniref:Uncharacterized protein n=1 Tax=Piloderma croceum (strain F 1598) TaxID=765440 RepID=A0A0C3G4P1_PILCF|nr:hypothetical protein PILCRDRAFT_168856 [Piloderma croceum F 1598]
MHVHILLNSSDLPMSSDLNQANKKARSTRYGLIHCNSLRALLNQDPQHQRLQHTPKPCGPITGPKGSYPYTIVSDAYREQHPRKDVDPNIREASPTSPARILLSQVRQYVELEVDRHGQKPAIMDIILGLMSPVHHNEDTLMDDMERARRLNQSHREYGRVFKNEESLHTYWAHQARIAAIHNDTQARSARFKISAERSTAGWEAALTGDDERSST